MNVEEYINAIDSQRKPIFIKLLKVIEENIPEGFEKGIQFGFPSFYVPLTRYPKGYRGNDCEPLPFLSLAAQKNYISLYHLAIYSDDTLLTWFQNEYAKHVPTKLNMGKSCIRFSNVKTIPFDLVGQLVMKISVEDWIHTVETFSEKQ